MIELTPSQIAQALGAPSPSDDETHPTRAVIDSREAGPGDLFFGIAGERVDGGTYAQAVIEQGAWVWLSPRSTPTSQARMSSSWTTRLPRLAHSQTAGATYSGPR
jgi:UDP-N-acetylmuramyl pentapeptide synthase